MKKPLKLASFYTRTVFLLTVVTTIVVASLLMLTEYINYSKQKRKTMNSADVMKMAQTKSLVLLAGPCVVEGEDLVMEVAGRVKEIADKLGITVSTSKSNLTRARAKLQGLVTEKIQIGIKR